MPSSLDQAISDVQTTEATYSADVQELVTIQAAIDSATAPLAPAQAKEATDKTAFNAALDALSAAALAAKVP